MLLSALVASLPPLLLAIMIAVFRVAPWRSAIAGAAADAAFPAALNPISPCGSCMEWLRKINEVNPDFTIITFPNSELDTAYLDPVG